MRREVAPIARPLRGDLGNAHVVLSGMFTVTQEDKRRGLLRPGDTFGGRLALGVTRTASVTAMTPAVVASCDRETLTSSRPLFADG